MQLLSLLDSLDRQIQDAKPIPLTDQIRLDKAPMYAILDEMREGVPETAMLADRLGYSKEGLGRTLPLIDEVDDMIHNGKPVPLTSQVRVSRPRLEEIISQMRANLTADREAGN